MATSYFKDQVHFFVLGMIIGLLIGLILGHRLTNRPKYQELDRIRELRHGIQYGRELTGSEYAESLMQLKYYEYGVKSLWPENFKELEEAYGQENGN